MTQGSADIPMISDEEEAELIASTDRGEWVSVGNIEEQRKYWKALAENTLAKKRKRISISVPERDLMKLKKRAEEEGMPYQTLINSILHKYVNQS
jgi:predicted DNA binding CopG/RHH family protein